MEMKKQSYNQYLINRIEFQIAVGMFLEYGYEFKLLSDFDLIGRTKEELKEIYKQVPKFKYPENTEEFEKGDMYFPCMQFASIFKKNPKDIATKMSSYVEQLEGIEKTEVVNGYLNIYFDRYKYFLHQI